MLYAKELEDAMLEEKPQKHWWEGVEEARSARTWSHSEYRLHGCGFTRCERDHNLWIYQETIRLFWEAFKFEGVKHDSNHLIVYIHLQVQKQGISIAWEEYLDACIMSSEWVITDESGL